MRLVFRPVVLGKRAGRRALKLLKRPARFERRLVSQRRMRPDGIVIVAPDRQLPAGVLQGVEDLLIQKLVAEAAVERLDEGVLLRLARVDIMPRHPILVGPLQDGAAGELGAVIADDASGLSADPHPVAHRPFYVAPET